MRMRILGIAILTVAGNAPALDPPPCKCVDEPQHEDCIVPTAIWTAGAPIQLGQATTLNIEVMQSCEQEKPLAEVLAEGNFHWAATDPDSRRHSMALAHRCNGGLTDGTVSTLHDELELIIPDQKIDMREVRTFDVSLTLRDKAIVPAGEQGSRKDADFTFPVSIKVKARTLPSPSYPTPYILDGPMRGYGPLALPGSCPTSLSRVVTSNYHIDWVARDCDSSSCHGLVMPSVVWTDSVASSFSVSVAVQGGSVYTFGGPLASAAINHSFAITATEGVAVTQGASRTCTPQTGLAQAGLMVQVIGYQARIHQISVVEKEVIRDCNNNLISETPRNGTASANIWLTGRECGYNYFIKPTEMVGPCQ